MIYQPCHAQRIQLLIKELHSLRKHREEIKVMQLANHSKFIKEKKKKNP